MLRSALVGAAILASADAFSAPAAIVRSQTTVSARSGLQAPAQLRAAPNRGVRGGVITLQSVTKADLEGCQKEIDKLLDSTNANPVMVRLAWHDSGTFDASIDGPWPKGAPISKVDTCSRVIDDDVTARRQSTELQHHLQPVVPSPRSCTSLKLSMAQTPVSLRRWKCSSRSRPNILM